LRNIQISTYILYSYTLYKYVYKYIYNKLHNAHHPVTETLAICQTIEIKMARDCLKVRITNDDE